MDFHKAMQGEQNTGRVPHAFATAGRACAPFFLLGCKALQNRVAKPLVAGKSV